jgi:predicted RNA-binding Zn ribbon-like protein
VVINPRRPPNTALTLRWCRELVKPPILFDGVRPVKSRRTADDETPASVALVQEFLNTLDLERFGAHAATPEEDRDVIRSPERLKGWLGEFGLVSQTSRVTARDVTRAADLRAGLRAMLRAAQGLPFEGDALQRGTIVGSRLPLRVRLEPGQPRLQSAAGDADGALSRLLIEVAVTHATGHLTRLKICSAEDCQFVFYDHSKSRTQRWCSMDTCGNREKTKRYRDRHRHTSGSERGKVDDF